VYYRGDYVPSGYYRGDPFLGAAVGFVARKIGLGALASKAGRWAAERITGSGLKTATKAVAGVAGTAAIGAVVNRVTTPSPISMGEIEMPGMGVGPSMGGMGGGGGGTQIIVTASGRRMRVRWSQTKQKWVAVRSMNPLNPKALNRSLRRASGFEKFAKKTMNALYKTSGGTRTRKFKKK